MTRLSFITKAGCDVRYCSDRRVISATLKSDGSERRKSMRDANPEPKPDLSPVERARVKEMEDEIRRLRMENEFLKKAAAFFARTPQ